MVYRQYQYVCGFYLRPSLLSRKIKQPGETEHMSKRKVTQARIDLRLSFGKWRRSRKRRVRGQSAPEKTPNSSHSTRHLAFATLLHDRMVIVINCVSITLGRQITVRCAIGRLYRYVKTRTVAFGASRNGLYYNSSARIHKQCQRRLSASD